MLRYLVLFCLAFSNLTSGEEPPKEELILSTPEEVATLQESPSFLIGGVISPLSGLLSLRHTDLIAIGAQPVTLSRVYISPQIPRSFGTYRYTQEAWDKFHLSQYLIHNYRGWRFYPHIHLQFTPQSNEVLVTDPSGITLNFRLSGPNFSTTTLASSLYGVTNVAGDMSTGKHDPRNTRIFYNGSNQIIINAPDGTSRIYYKELQNSATSYLYVLEREILPNGKLLKYQYQNSVLAPPTSIQSLDPQERFVYASITLEGMPWSEECHFTSSSGTSAHYTYQKKSDHVKLKNKFENGIKYKAEHHLLYPPTLSSVSSPFYRHESLEHSSHFLLNACYGKEDVFKALYTVEKEVYKVQKLFLPVGQQDSFEPVYELFYDSPVAGQRGGSTVVKNSDGTSIIYHFSKELLTTLIQYLDQEGTVKKEVHFSWYPNQWLASIETKDGKGVLFHKKSYEYDLFGNPILEMFQGDLTGNGTQANSITKRIFSQEGRHLLLQEETQGGKVVCFSYLPRTNLLTCKLIKDQKKILLREFWVYDDCYNLTQKISDDGNTPDKENLSGVTERRITSYLLRQSAPFLHMPEWIIETAWQEGSQTLLGKKHLIYDDRGYVAQEEHYTAEGIYAYTLYKTYNERGDLLSETDPLGNEASYSYDARGRLQSSINFSQRLETTCTYDTKGRLLFVEEKGDEGTVHTLSSEYDFQGRLLSKKDPFGNSTHYTYDSVVNEVIKTDFPHISSIEEEEISVTSHATYDSLGRLLSKTDPNGNLINYRYNAYGSPTEISYPDGSKELFRYRENGDLWRHTDPDGYVIEYTQDVLGRTLTKTYLSKKQTLVAEDLFIYSGFHLREETDKEGNSKKYFYDGGGRKTREEFGSHATDFFYDSLGRLATICAYNGENALFTHYTRDLKGQILEVDQTDSVGSLLHRVCYSYDLDGNQRALTKEINGEKAVDIFTYDPFGRRLSHIDPKGSETKTLYNETFLNSLGQRVLQKITVDPIQTTSIETQDALSRTCRIAVLNSYQNPISLVELFHDPQGNLLYQKDHLYQGERERDIQTIKYTYTPSNQVKTMTRAYGTPEARTTSYSYIPSGKLATKTLPSGVTLHYSYDSLGFLQRLTSSDKKIDHSFDYDLLGHLLRACDKNNSLIIERRVDPYGNVTQELFPSGLHVDKKYDDFNRLISLTISEQGEIRYEYDPLFLRSVTRISPEGAFLYTHSYETYDTSGNLISEMLPQSLTRITHSTELCGEKGSISSPYFSQTCTYDSLSHLIKLVEDREELHFNYDDLSQLSSEKGSLSQTLYCHDSLYNRVKHNQETHAFNHLNELLLAGKARYSYDLNGNQSLCESASESAHFSYDPLGRLLEISSDKKKVQFTYDPLDRRMSKAAYTSTSQGWEETSYEVYLYDGVNEIGAFTLDHTPKNFRVLSFPSHSQAPTTVAVEIEGDIFAPFLDVQGNIRRLVDLGTKSTMQSYDFTAFGEEVRSKISSSLYNPWRFASKRLDSEFGLIYFGKRYYDPRSGRWLNPDPAGFIDSTNLYQYVLNNPFLYLDPQGESAFALPLITWGAGIILFPFLSAAAVPVMCGAATAALLYGGYKIISSSIAAGYVPRTVWDLPSRYTETMHSVENSSDNQAYAPPHNGQTLGNDPGKCPGEGFEWQGKGEPESGKGSWIKGKGKDKETLHPDLNHPPPKKPHWDYNGPKAPPKGIRLNTDGTWEFKR